VIVAIPIPIILKTRLSIWKKLLLMLLLCCGIFVIVATILRTYYSLQSITLLPVAAGWTSRELFVAAAAVSIPGIKPLFSQATWFRSIKRSKPSDAESNPLSGFELKSPPVSAQWRSGPGKKKLKGTRLSSDGSEDFIISDQDDDKYQPKDRFGIHVTNVYSVSTIAHPASAESKV
jgi:hypothetical protein